jgi:ketosteroid isomerase-like protein
MHSRDLFRLAVLLASVSCAQHPPAVLKDTERRAIADSVVAVARSYEAAAATLDAERLLSFWTTDSGGRVIDNGHVTPMPEFVSHVRQALPALRRTDFRFETIEPLVLSRDVVLIDANQKQVLTDTSGAVARLRGAATWVWVRGPAGWRIAHWRGESSPDTSRVP